MDQKELNKRTSLKTADDKVNVKRINNLHTLRKIEKQQTEFGENR